MYCKQIYMNLYKKTITSSAWKQILLAYFVVFDSNAYLSHWPKTEASISKKITVICINT